VYCPSRREGNFQFEDAVGLACESASVRQVARQAGLVASTVRAIDLRYLQRWSATRRKQPLKQMGVDEIYFGKQMKFITMVSNLVPASVWVWPCASDHIGAHFGWHRTALRLASLAFAPFRQEKEQHQENSYGMSAMIDRMLRTR
jgi:hypothetical protein